MTTLSAPSQPAAGHVDGRSVDELLREATLTARGMLWDPEEDAAGKVRSWDALVHTAAWLWTAIPAATTARDEQLDHLIDVTATMQRATARTDWPGPGRGHPDMESITDDMARAAALISARRIPNVPLSAQGEKAAESSRVRILHTLHVTGHAVSIAVQHHQRALAGVHPRLQRTMSHKRAVRVTTDIRNHLASIEADLETQIDLRWPAGLAAQPPPDVHTSRLEEAITAWDHQAHRAISSKTSIANLLFITDMQRNLGFTTAVVSGAAARTGTLDPTLQQRLHPHLVELERAWGTLHRQLRTFTRRSEIPSLELIRDFRELRSAQQELTHDKATQASPEHMATRTDLAATTRSLHQSLGTSVNLAYLIAEVIESDLLRVPARAAHHYASNLHQDNPAVALHRHVTGETSGLAPCPWTQGGLRR